MGNILEKVEYLTKGYDHRHVEVIDTDDGVKFFEVKRGYVAEKVTEVAKVKGRKKSIVKVKVTYNGDDERYELGMDTMNWCCDKGRLPSDLVRRYSC